MVIEIWPGDYEEHLYTANRSAEQENTLLRSKGRVRKLNRFSRKENYNSTACMIFILTLVLGVTGCRIRRSKKR